MSFDVEKLYVLLPAIYRIRDTELGKQLLTSQDREEIAQLELKLEGITDSEGEEARQIRRLLDEKQRGPLKALLSVIADQMAALEEDLDQLYDDLFIETCAEWVVPYIADLVGTSDLFVFPDATLSQRAQVANTLAYRRRKGTAAILEQLARDVTAWHASVVEYFLLLATTQYLNHLRPSNISIADLKQWELLEHLNTPFDRMTRTVDVRRIESQRGKYNIPNVGIFLWRLGSYSLTNSPAFKVDDRRYLFDVLGKDTPIYNRPVTEEEITHLAEPTNIPMPISRRILDKYLDSYYGIDKSILLTVDDEVILPSNTSPPSDKLSDLITVCNLSDIIDAGGSVIGWANTPQDKIAIDPVLGRIAFPVNESPPAKVHVTYHYGFSGKMGGGQYDRPSLPTATTSITPGGITLIDAVANAGPGEDVIQIDYSGKIDGDLTIDLSPGQRLTIQAKNGNRPVIVGSIKIESAKDAEVTIDGLLITGGVEVGGTEKIKLILRHCTLVPWLEKDKGEPKPLIMPSVKWLESGSIGTIILARTISGRLITGEGICVEISDTIVDALQDSNIALAASDGGDIAAGNVKIIRSTIIGTVYVREIELAENNVFTGLVTSDRKQQGCVRFSYLPRDSNVPRRYCCQPDLKIKQEIDSLRKQKSDLSSDDLDNIAQEVNAWLRPSFTSRYYGQPAYMQLHSSCPIEIRSGADDDAEMGAFHNLYQPQREANLRARLEEYLRVGLKAGIFYAS